MSEKDLSISDMQKMQLELYEVNKEKWNDMEPKAAKSHILYMIEEIGECYIHYKEKRYKCNNGRQRHKSKIY